MPKVVVAQRGAREHFLAALALHKRGMLAALVTDWYAFQGRGHLVSRCLQGFASFRRMNGVSAARRDEIPETLVRSFPVRSIVWKQAERKAVFSGSPQETYLRTDAAFGRAVSGLRLPPHDVFFGYSYASLEAMRAAKNRGSLVVLDQIDPGELEHRIVMDEMLRFPEIAGAPFPAPMEYYERNRQEWNLADAIIVNSEWSRTALVAQGADPAKIDLLPLSYELSGSAQDPVRPSTVGPARPLRVLWLGQVNLRKGIHYLIAAARLLRDAPVQIDVVGPLGVSDSCVQSAPPSMRFHGRVCRNNATEWYRNSDIFVLPTLSDGFALTQLEALANGLPVIATPNCGQIVADSETGFIVPARDPQAIAAAILKFVHDPRLISAMRPRCRDACRRYSLEAYGNGLTEIIENRVRFSRGLH